MLGIDLSNLEENVWRRVILLSCNYKFFTASKFEGNEPIRISVQKIVNNITGYKPIIEICGAPVNTSEFWQIVQLKKQLAAASGQYWSQFQWHHKNFSKNSVVICTHCNIAQVLHFWCTHCNIAQVLHFFLM